jgi:hypothetical protein
MEELIGVARKAPAALLMLLAEPPAQPGDGVFIQEPVGFRDGTELEIVGPALLQENVLRCGSVSFCVSPAVKRFGFCGFLR